MGVFHQTVYALSYYQLSILYELHGFDSVESAKAYLDSEMFKNDVFVGLKPLWDADPEIKIYSVA